MQVYQMYKDMLYNVSYRIIKNEYDAQDTVHDAFIKAFQNISKLENDLNLGPWLKRIVVNNSIAHYNKTSKQNEVPLETVMYKVDENNGVEEISQNTFKVKQIMRVMKTLKPNYSLGLSLHLIEGYDYEEICEIMDISYANCRTMISRAKESLRKKLMQTA